MFQVGRGVPLRPRQNQGGGVPCFPQEGRVRQGGQVPPDARRPGRKDAGLYLLREGHVLHAQLPLPARESQSECGGLPQLLEGWLGWALAYMWTYVALCAVLFAGMFVVWERGGCAKGGGGFITFTLLHKCVSCCWWSGLWCTSFQGLVLPFPRSYAELPIDNQTLPVSFVSFFVLFASVCRALFSVLRLVGCFVDAAHREQTNKRMK